MSMKKISRLFSNLTEYNDKSLTRVALGTFNENRREGESDIIRREYYTDPEFNPKFMLGLAFGNKYCKATQSLAITAQHARAFYDIPFLPLIAQYVILSNVDFERKFLKKSPKNDLVNKIIKENYKRIGYFELKLPMYNFLDNYFYYPYLGLFAYPHSISIYKK